MRCPACGSESPASARFCSSCGGLLESANDATLAGDESAALAEETLASDTPLRTPHRSPAAPSGSSRPPSASRAVLSSSGAIGGGRFGAGQIIADRYRIVALAGRGGMGDVYRAEDLKLSQIVAIKFLPASLSQDAGALARFHSEVRIARQVSHPNVCRVFDIGDAEGVPFLTMEYVDGEDLSSLVRRIGRLSTDKAVEIARQICAGLSAAHGRGVIHRDLKPANLMLDSSGRIRITDFGLASIAASIEASDVRAGTPAYMAPEQLEGKEVTVKSDLYSLGLVLYEILTGKRAFNATTLPELIRQRESSVPANPSAIVRDLDPLIERVILRCLEKEPAQRPASALQVAAALPGGDPLAAALAAGETPSPDMVAAAGATGGMRPRNALLLLGTVALGLVAMLAISDRFRLHNKAPLDNAPEVLAARAREVIRQLGYAEPYGDEAFSFGIQGNYLDYLQEHDKSQARWSVLERGRPASVIFWYRRSPQLMRPQSFFSAEGEIGPLDPPLDTGGMVSLALDMQGRLLHLEAVPHQRGDFPEHPQAPDWSSIFATAGLDQAAYRLAHPKWTPPRWGDTRAAWSLATPGMATELPERVEAAGYGGKPIYFDVIYPWTKSELGVAASASSHRKISAAILITLFIALLVSGMFVTRRNLRLKRGDTRGALRLAIVVFLTFLGAWLLLAHHITSTQEFNSMIVALSWALMVTALATMLYLALEPYVRRRDPHTLISWSRLLAGQWRDPLVGRDVLIGICYGVLLTLFEQTDNFLLPLFGAPPPQPGGIQPETLLGVRPALGQLLLYVLIFLMYALFIFFFLFLLRLALKRDWIAAIVIVLLGAGTNPGAEYPVVTFVLLGIIWLSIVLVLKRVGLLAILVGLVVQNVLVVFPMTFHLSRWYATAGLTGIVVILALTIYGFFTALAGQRIFSVEALDK